MKCHDIEKTIIVNPYRNIPAYRFYIVTFGCQWRMIDEMNTSSGQICQKPYSICLIMINHLQGIRR